MKKEEYIRQELMQEDTLSIIAELKQSGFCRERPLRIESPALLVLDMQNYFLLPQSHAYLPSAPALIQNVKKIVDLFDELQLPIIFTRHCNNIENAKMMAERWQELTPCDGELFQIHSEIFKANHIIIDKNQYDAFYQTKLEEYLLKQNINTLIICGVVSNLCVETSARSAFVRGFRPIVPIDTCASFNRELHLISMKNISYSLGETPVLAKIIEETANWK